MNGVLLMNGEMVATFSGFFLFVFYFYVFTSVKNRHISTVMASSSQRGKEAVTEWNPPSPPPPPVGDVNATRAPPGPDQLAAFNGLVERVVTAGTLGRHAHHLELAGRAAAQAEALFREDSLVVASLHWGEVNALWNVSCDANAAEAELLDRRAWALLLPLHALLLRRVAANTLLSVRKEESEHAAHLVVSGSRAASEPEPSKALLQAAGRMMGYNVLLQVAVETVKLLGSRRWPRAQEASATSFVLDSLDVIPRTHSCVMAVSAEISFVHAITQIVGGPSSSRLSGHRLRVPERPALQMEEPSDHRRAPVARNFAERKRFFQEER